MPTRHPPISPPFPRSPDLIVLGGGIIGLACACELARHGLRVEVFERNAHGAEASVAAAGMLAPLAEVPEPGPMLAACRDGRDLWRSFQASLAADSEMDLDYDDSGALMVALDARQALDLERLAAAAETVGEACHPLEASEARRRVPHLPAQLRRACWLPGEHRVDNVKVCAALALTAERLGVAVHRGGNVERVTVEPRQVRVETGEIRRQAGALILAAGAWSGAIAGLPPLPIEPVRGQMMLLGGVDWTFSGILRARDLYTVRRGESCLLVGATTERVGFAPHTTPGGLSKLAAGLGRLLPGLCDHRLEASWAGLRPGTPDGLPLIGPIGDLPVLAATGHYRNGILLAPWTARRIADWVLDGGPANDLSPFSPNRFL